MRQLRVETKRPVSISYSRSKERLRIPHKLPGGLGLLGGKSNIAVQGSLDCSDPHIVPPGPSEGDLFKLDAKMYESVQERIPKGGNYYPTSFQTHLGAINRSNGPEGWKRILDSLSKESINGQNNADHVFYQKHRVKVADRTLVNVWLPSDHSVINLPTVEHAGQPNSLQRNPISKSRYQSTQRGNIRRGSNKPSVLQFLLDINEKKDEEKKLKMSLSPKVSAIHPNQRPNNIKNKVINQLKAQNLKNEEESTNSPKSPNKLFRWGSPLLNTGEESKNSNKQNKHKIENMSNIDNEHTEYMDSPEMKKLKNKYSKVMKECSHGNTFLKLLKEYTDSMRRHATKKRKPNTRLKKPRNYKFK